MSKRKPRAEAQPAEAAPPPDPVADALIAAKLVPNRYLLDLNSGLQASAEDRVDLPWSLPSRLFQFPVEVGEAPDRRVGLLHPLLAAHPFAARVEAALGFALEPGGAPNKAGYTKVGMGQWWHAVDLIGTHWRALLDTRQFTTDDCIAGAVAFALRCSGKSPFGLREAHLVLREIGAERPESPLDGLAAPTPCEDRWPVNHEHRLSGSAQAWALVCGIEAGWLKHGRSGFLGWTEAGRDAYARQTEPAAREIADHVPPARAPQQLSLF